MRNPRRRISETMRSSTKVATKSHYALSIGTRINDLGWPWTAIMLCYVMSQVCVLTSRLYVADVQCVWSVRVPSCWARQHVDEVLPMSLSVTEARLLLTCRTGHRLTLFDVNGKLLRQVCGTLEADWTNTYVLMDQELWTSTVNCERYSPLPSLSINQSINQPIENFWVA